MALTKRTYVDFDQDIPITAQNLNDIQDEIIANARDSKVLVLTVSNISSLEKTVSNNDITSDMVVVNYVLSNPSAQIGNWSVITSDKSLRITGSISGTTNLTLYLEKSR